MRKTELLLIVSMLFLTCFFTSRSFAVKKEKKISISNKPKKVTFKLGVFTSELDNFRDTALKSLDLLSKVFSSPEFKDSISKYDFPCSNVWYHPCKIPGKFIIVKCDSAANLLHGATVYQDLLAEKTVTLDLTIKHPKGKTGSYGWSDACIYKISSYSWWLKNDRKQPLSEEYAIHLAHEYCHIAGYYHSKHSRKEDVAYRMGGIVRNILWDWSHPVKGS